MDDITRIMQQGTLAEAVAAGLIEMDELTETTSDVAVALAFAGTDVGTIIDRGHEVLVLLGDYSLVRIAKDHAVWAWERQGAEGDQLGSGWEQDAGGMAARVGEMRLTGR